MGNAKFKAHRIYFNLKQTQNALGSYGISAPQVSLQSQPQGDSGLLSSGVWAARGQRGPSQLGHSRVSPVPSSEAEARLPRAPRASEPGILSWTLSPPPCAQGSLLPPQCCSEASLLPLALSVPFTPSVPGYIQFLFKEQIRFLSSGWTLTDACCFLFEKKFKILHGLHSS